MIEIPTITRRLLSQPAPGKWHPDAALVTGLVESALPPRLRDRVMDHMAVCKDCRDLLWLARQEKNRASVSEVFSFRKALRWSPVRWAAGVAGAAIVATSVWMLHIEQLGHSRSADPTPSMVASERPVQPLPTPRTTTTAIGAVAPADSANRSRSHEKQVPAGSIRREMIETSVNVNSTARSSDRPVASADSAAVSDRPDTVEDGKHIMWMVAGPGLVYESFDHGVRWQSVAIADGVSFRAVTSIGSMVWAGGRAGALFKSADSGLHWTKVNLFGGPQAITTDSIEAITFSNAQQGMVKTALGSVWITSDGGDTWTRAK